MSRYTIGNTVLQIPMGMLETLPPEDFLLSQEGLTRLQQTEARLDVTPDRPGTLRVFGRTLRRTAEDAVCRACSACRMELPDHAEIRAERGLEDRRLRLRGAVQMSALHSALRDRSPIADGRARITIHLQRFIESLPALGFTLTEVAETSEMRGQVKAVGRDGLMARYTEDGHIIPPKRHTRCCGERAIGIRCNTHLY